MKKNKLQMLAATLLGVFLLSFAPATSAQTSAAPAPDDLKQIDQLRHGLVDAFNRRDIDAMLHYLDPNVVVVWQNGEINQGPEAVRQYYNRMMVQGVVKSVTFDPVVQDRACHGSTCVSVGTLQDTFTLNDGRVLPLNSRWTATVIKSDSGTWGIAAFHASANVFDNPVIHIATHKVGMYSGGAGLLAGLILGALFFRRSKA
jgi:ketosteroid isomerase-like protein